MTKKELMEKLLVCYELLEIKQNSKGLESIYKRIEMLEQELKGLL